MRSTVLGAVAVLLLPIVVAAPGIALRETEELRPHPKPHDPIAPKPVCKSPAVRVDYTTLTKAQKANYWKAIACLIKKPRSPVTKWAQAKSRYDDVAATHFFRSNLSDRSDTWHHVGQFFHQHRAYLAGYESLLRKECGFTAPLPYWKEWKDAGNFKNAMVVKDFGGPGPGIIKTGFLAKKECPYGPAPSHMSWSQSLPLPTQNVAHTLWRNVSESYSSWANATSLKKILAIPDFAVFKNTLYRSLHTAGHFGLGGDMAHAAASSNDPLFHLHHAYIDALWWQWQQVAPKERIHAIAPNEFIGFTSTVNMTQHTVLSTSGLLPNYTVHDVADTQGGILCYTYEGLLS